MRNSKAALCIILGGIVLGPAHSQERFPSKPITLISTSAPGGFGDASARLIATGLSERIGQPVVLEPRPGGGGAVGITAVMRAPADGHTFLYTFSSSMTMQPLINKDISYDAQRDFIVLTQVAAAGTMLATSPNSEINNAAQLIAYAKSNPGKLSMGITGAGNKAMVAQMGAMSGARINDINFAGEAPISTALLGGHLDIAVLSSGTAKTLADSGKAKLIAVTTSKRINAFPNVQAIAEVIPGFQFTSWQGLWLPAGTPRDRVDRLSRELTTFLQGPSSREFFSRYFYDVIANSPQEAATVQKAEVDGNIKAVKDFGITAN